MAGDPLDPRLIEFARTRDVALRNDLVLDNRGLAIAFSRRYRNRGVPAEDLDQVATEALVRSIDRFDPERGVRFSTYAARVIEGELKQYFRDRTWDVAVPRSMRELATTVRRTTDDLTQQLGRQPTPSEVADAIGVGVDDVVLALESAGAARADPLDASPLEPRGEPTERYDHVENALTAAALLDRLPDDLRRVVELRFFDDLSQSQIAAEIGVSQMQVSRLLRRALERLRAGSDLD